MHPLIKRMAKMPEVQSTIFFFVMPPGSLDISLRHNALTKNAKNATAAIILPAISIPVPESKQKPITSNRSIHANTVIPSLTTILSLMAFIFLRYTNTDANIAVLNFYSKSAVENS